MRVDERNGEDRFVRTKAGDVQGAKNKRNIVLFTPSLQYVEPCLQRDRVVKSARTVR